ncbi:recombinase RecA [Metamycoplasma hyosynoviae]|uniref:Protein RecA n=2 Tax=Metamycoplasma hyosynoviae TaxID=29559 RepID=A0AAP4AKH8_9BACT|nr:recombinase RecA [Metamycoplasma hyosynoviae]MDC8900905.1 recombinase RecA [Metamycoplasma hyosynoviae]MDC8912411.1 recombinase RecA [Metamycoplasma hyosynoviae]MDC8912803.1 recombinase RecA [Metamycoplasma hyosynoviae]MDC8914890.1 recombinase RecA [Metamycoplasma hyosynoviae]MDC8915471.1 recombinase RecA [Metamycoplasma hyosynoviae]
MSKSKNNDWMDSLENNKELQEALKEIEKKFGKESIMILGSKPDIIPEVIDSGSIAINKALGINGWPKGRVVEIYGPESSGKTTIALHAIAEVQKKGGIAAFIDAEHSIDPLYAKNLGIDINKLILSQPDSGEQALEIVDCLSKTGSIDLIVVDSVAALVPEAELNGEMRDQVIGVQARLMSKALRKITASLSKNKTTVIFINQIREKIGVMFGNPETTPGGKALKFYSTVRVEVRKQQTLGQGENIIGNQVKCKVVKNKLAAPYKTAQIEIVFSKGISKLAEIIKFAEDFEILEKKGSWYSFEGENIAQGAANLQALLLQNTELKNKIENLVLEKLNIQN